MDEKIQFAPETNTQQVINYAQWYSRAASYIVDTILVSLITGVISVVLISIFTIIGVPQFLSIALSYIIALVLNFYYYIYFLTREGMTPGLKFLGIKVVKEDGTLLNGSQVIVRTLLFMILSLVNIIMILVTQKRQGLHDMASGSVCLNVNENTSKAKWVLGCYCGCSILLIVIPIVAGLGTALTSSDYLQKQIMRGTTEVKQTTPALPKNNLENRYNTNDESPSLMDELDQEPTTLDMNETPTNTSNGNNSQSEVYKACMSLNTDPKIDISGYCACAEKESKLTTDLNAIVNKCRGEIKVRN